MRRALAVAVASLAFGAETALSEIYKCVDDTGRVTFVNDPGACANPQPHDLKGRVDRAPSSTTLAKEALPDRRELESPEARLEWSLLTQRDVRPKWEIVEETPEDVRKDADLVEWGVTAKRARHYTRKSGDASQVCSIELWAFENEARARLANENFEFPDWKIDRSGDTLVMVRAVTLRDEQADRTIFPDCDMLGGIVRTRAAKFSDE